MIQILSTHLEALEKHQIVVHAQHHSIALPLQAPASLHRPPAALSQQGGMSQGLSQAHSLHAQQLSPYQQARRAQLVSLTPLVSLTRLEAPTPCPWSQSLERSQCVREAQQVTEAGLQRFALRLPVVACQTGGEQVWVDAQVTDAELMSQCRPGSACWARQAEQMMQEARLRVLLPEVVSQAVCLGDWQHTEAPVRGTELVTRSAEVAQGQAVSQVLLVSQAAVSQVCLTQESPSVPNVPAKVSDHCSVQEKQKGLATSDLVCSSQSKDQH